MRILTCAVLLSLTAAAPAHAQVFVQTPWALIRVGPPAPTRVLVQTPWATVGVPPPGTTLQQAAVPPSAGPVYVPGAPPAVPLPIPVEAAVSRAPTLDEFAATFKPRGGHYEIVIEHPMTGKPVRVSFTLPEGIPRRVNVHRRELDFEYRGKEVSLRFLRGGEVRVRE
jgi:hypothetical protein